MAAFEKYATRQDRRTDTMTDTDKDKNIAAHTPMMQHYLDVYYFPFVFNALNLR